MIACPPSRSASSASARSKAKAAFLKSPRLPITAMAMSSSGMRRRKLRNPPELPPCDQVLRPRNSRNSCPFDDTAMLPLARRVRLFIASMIWVFPTPLVLSAWPQRTRSLGVDTIPLEPMAPETYRKLYIAERPGS